MFCIKTGGSLVHWLFINSTEAHASSESRQLYAYSSTCITISSVLSLSGLIQAYLYSLSYKKKNLPYFFELRYFFWVDGFAWSQQTLASSGCARTAGTAGTRRAARSGSSCTLACKPRGLLRFTVSL